MPEPTDFEQMARALIDPLLDPYKEGDLAATRTAVAEQLRQVWNARGAADRLAVADLLVEQPSNICQPVQYVIRKLDR